MENIKNCLIVKNKNMGEICSFKCGGVSDVAYPKSFNALLKFVEKVQNFFLIGKGTNLLVVNYNGIFLSLDRMPKILKEIYGDRVEVSANVSLFKLNAFLAERGLAGLEWSYGIPGSVGGAVFMNAGAYGGEISKFIEKVLILDEKGLKIWKKREEIEFSYRKSEIKGIILKVVLSLKKGNKNEIYSKQIEHFNLKKDKQPLNYPSAGSVFKRQNEFIPAIIIDKLGLKGVTIGGAKISEKHAGFIVNFNNAKALDVLTLIQFIKNEVKQKIDLSLEEEIIILNEEKL